MPEPYWPKKGEFPLSRLNEHMQLVRVRCAYCRRLHHYRPDDLIQIFGDVDVDSLAAKMKCEGGPHGLLEVKGIIPSGKEAVGLKIRRLAAIKFQLIPVWRDD